MIALPRKTKLMLASLFIAWTTVGCIAHELATINNHPAPTPNKGHLVKPSETVARRNGHVPEPSNGIHVPTTENAAGRNTHRNTHPNRVAENTVKTPRRQHYQGEPSWTWETRRLWEQGRTPSLKSGEQVPAPSSTSAPSPKHSPHHLGRERPASDRRFGECPYCHRNDA